MKNFNPKKSILNLGFYFLIKSSLRIYEYYFEKLLPEREFFMKPLIQIQYGKIFYFKTMN